MALFTYKTLDPRGVVVAEGSATVYYPYGSIFEADPNNASIQALIARAYVALVSRPNHPTPNATIQPIVLTQPGLGPPGPPGPQGPPGPAGSSTATQLATTGASVVINTAAPPTTGQVLTATSATAADWETPAASGNGVPLTVVAKTSDYTLLSSDAQKVFTNRGAPGIVNFTLPTWASGLSYNIAVATAQTVQVTAPGSDVIQVSTLTSSGGGNTSASSVGSSLKLVAVASGLWMAMSVTGTWVVA